MKDHIKFHSFITLAHFCDIHGPRVVAITQVAGNNEALEEILLPDYPTDSYCESCLIQFPNIDDQRQRQNIDKDTEIKLRSMDSLINSNHYVSTQYSATRYLLLSSIVKKIFSEETMVYDESPLIFYDQERGFNLAVGFKISDNYSRGNERRYCLIFSISEIEEMICILILEKHMDFILSSFGKMISYMKKQRNQVLLKKQQDAQNPFMPTSSYLRSNTLKLPKNISELIQDDQFFMKLHKWNSFVLTNIEQPF